MAQRDIDVFDQLAAAAAAALEILDRRAPDNKGCGPRTDDEEEAHQKAFTDLLHTVQDAVAYELDFDKRDDCRNAGCTFEWHHPACRASRTGFESADPWWY